MIEQHLRGSYYEIGNTIGKQIKGMFQIPPISKDTIEFANRCKPIVKNFCPGITEEIRGLAEGTNLDLDLLNAFILALGKDMIDEGKKLMAHGIDFGCTSFAISNEHSSEKGPIFARNYDWSESFAPYFTVIRAQSEDGIPNISFTDHPIGRYGGINKEGLALSIHAFPEYLPDWKPGIRMNVIARWVLDTFKSTEEAIRFLEKIPHICGHNYLIADKDDNLARIETAADEIVVTRAKDGFIATTNHALSHEMKKYTNPHFRFEGSVDRYNRIRKWYEKTKGKITKDAIKYILSDHEEGVCSHFEFAGERTSTIWSWISVLGTDYVDICAGSPCINDYMSNKF
jgi:predicted choloylglycine hydrolase